MSSSLRRGRQFFANPGPTNIPESVLRAIDHVSVDFMDPAFLDIYHAAVDGLKRVLRTEQRVFLYTASGHGSWEATLVNLFSPGDAILLVESGYFSEAWGRMASDLGLEVRTVAADWRQGVDVSRIGAALREDRGHAIRAVCAVHNETATGVALHLPDIRAAIDEARHPALFLADTISSLGSMDFQMDAWGIDTVVGGSQKGLMLPTGFSFTGVSAKAFEAHRHARMPKHYFSWSNMDFRPHKSFVGTIPTSLFFGLRESIRLLEEEGLDAVFARHARLAGAVRACVRAWSGNDWPELFCANPARASNSVTAILLPEGHDADAVRRVALDRFNVSTGGGLGPLTGRVFRIGHLGDLNEPMVLGALAGVEMSLRAAGVPHGRGGIEAAMDALAV